MVTGNQNLLTVFTYISARELPYCVELKNFVDGGVISLSVPIVCETLFVHIIKSNAILSVSLPSSLRNNPVQTTELTRAVITPHLITEPYAKKQTIDNSVELKTAC